MAQYRVDSNQFLASNKTIYEVVMIADNEGNLGAGGNFTGTGVDAFGRARFSTPLTLFDASNILEVSEEFSAVTSGTANTNWVVNKSEVELNVDTGSGDTVTWQSNRNMSYQPGKSLLILATFAMNEGKTNLVQRVGYFNDENGFFLEQDGTDVYLVKRSYVTGAAVDTKVAQASWNGDSLDGTAATSTTGYVLDVTKTQIFWVDMEWLGVGSARCGFVIDGKMITAHTFHNANQNESVYMTSANLPIRYQITNSDTTASASVMKAICCSGLSEGGYEPRGKRKVISTADIATGANVAETAFFSLCSIRLRDTEAVAVIDALDILNISNADGEWGLFIDPTPNAAFTWANTTVAVQTSLTNTDLTSNGTRVAGGYLVGKASPIAFSGDGMDWDYQLGKYANGTPQVFTLAVKSASASKKAAGMLKWLEL